MNCYAAPMEGVTGAMYRRVHQKCFPGADKYVTPFLTPTRDHVFTPREKREVLPQFNQKISVVPQIMTRCAEDFLWCARQLGEMGYEEVNLNLGCPSGTVVAKGKGAGLLGRPKDLEAFLMEIFSAEIKPKISIKTRLGLNAPEEFSSILALYRRFPVWELTVHPRVRTDLYRGSVRLEWYEQALTGSPFPVCYNGDLTCVEDIRALRERFPQTGAVMVGRGLLADPALLRKWKGGAPAKKEELATFLDELYREYTAAFGSRNNAMLRLKEVWSYLIYLFADRDFYRKKLQRARDAGEYDTLLAGLFRDLELLESSEVPWRGETVFTSK